jgi:hypothetical protein
VLWDGNARSLSQCQSLRSLTDLSITYSEHHAFPVLASYPNHIPFLEALSGCGQLQSLTILAKDSRFDIPQLSETVWKELQRSLERGNDLPPVALPSLRFFSASGDPRWILQWLTQLEANLPDIRHLSIDIFHPNCPRRFGDWDHTPPHVLEMIRPMLKAMVKCSNLHTLSFGCSNEDYHPTSTSREMHTFPFEGVLRYLKAARSSLQWILIGKALFVDCDTTGENAIRDIFDTFPKLEGIRFPNDSSISRHSLVASGSTAAVSSVLLPLNDWFVDTIRASSGKQFYSPPSQHPRLK